VAVGSPARVASCCHAALTFFPDGQFSLHFLDAAAVFLQTMRAYVDMLRMEDKIYAHPTYAKVRCC
jgi:hypothetical protein